MFFLFFPIFFASSNVQSLSWSCPPPCVMHPFHFTHCLHHENIASFFLHSFNTIVLWSPAWHHIAVSLQSFAHIHPNNDCDHTIHTKIFRKRPRQIPDTPWLTLQHCQSDQSSWLSQRGFPPSLLGFLSFLLSHDIWREPGFLAIFADNVGNTQRSKPLSPQNTDSSQWHFFAKCHMQLQTCNMHSIQRFIRLAIFERWGANVTIFPVHNMSPTCHQLLRTTQQRWRFSSGSQHVTNSFTQHSNMLTHHCFNNHLAIERLATWQWSPFSLNQAGCVVHPPNLFDSWNQPSTPFSSF